KASGTDLVPLSLLARSDHRDTSDWTRASQARLAWSHDSKSAFCSAIAASVCSCPQFINGAGPAFTACDPAVSLIAITQYLLGDRVYLCANKSIIISVPGSLIWINRADFLNRQARRRFLPISHAFSRSSIHVTNSSQITASTIGPRKSPVMP